MATKPFRTVVTPEKPDFNISHTDIIVSIGSCFSENIGKYFSNYKFNININPFGQQYNPESMMVALRRLISGMPYKEDELVYHDELYHSFDHHGSFSRSTAEETLQVINSNLAIASEALKKASVLFLTFGTAHVFLLKKEDRVVSNCHKLSGSMFDRSIMTPEEIADSLEETLPTLKKVNPNLKIVMTVSPVRYFAFGHHENTVSKAYLFAGMELFRMCNFELPFYYFPAYELVMDDLRDYRFFAEDMLHPNYQATEYVWNVLKETMFGAQTQQLMGEIDEILLAARHRPRNSNSEAHRKFVEKNLNKIEALSKQHSLNFSNESLALAQSLVNRSAGMEGGK